MMKSIEFRDLSRQYSYMKDKIDNAMRTVISEARFIQGSQVQELENTLATYVGKEYCITCANGTDAIQLALMAWEIGEGDVVFVPDFTFFSSGEAVAAVGAIPVFVDVDKDTYNIDVSSLKKMIEKTIREKEGTPRAIIAVDLFGQPADYVSIKKIAVEYDLYILEDSAQGFGGKIDEERACSFGDIAITSFFPAKPFGCYGDGGAVFTDRREWADIMRSLQVHGRGLSKYDNVRIGMNSRLDTIQAAVLLVKFPVFIKEELAKTQELAKLYTQQLEGIVKTPVIKQGFYSSWAQYTIQVKNKETRDALQVFLKEQSIPSAIYYPKPMHRQKAFRMKTYCDADYLNTNVLCETVLSLPFHPYMNKDEVMEISRIVISYMR